MLVLELELIINMLRRRLIIIAVTGIVMGCLGAVVAVILPPIYESSAILSIADNPIETSLPGDAASSLATLVGIAPGRNTVRREELLASLTSRSFIAKFISDQSLMPLLFADKWDMHSGEWKDAGNVPSVNDAYDLFTDKLFSVNENRRTGLISVTLRSRRPDLAAIWLTRLLAQADLEQRAQARERAQKSLVYLKDELGRTASVEMQQLIYRLIEAQLRDDMLASVAEEFAFRIVDPPLVPDVDKPVSPKRLVIVVGLVLVGFGSAVVWAIWPGVYFSSRGKRPQPAAK